MDLEQLTDIAMKVLLLALAPLLAAGCGAAPVSGRAPVELDPVALLALRGDDLDGNAVHLGSLVDAGKPAAVIFWQTWCESCLEEAPRLAKDARAWGDRIAFVGVVPGPDDVVRESEVRRVAAEHALPYRQVRDRDLAWTKAFRVQGTPVVVVIDGEGRVLFRGHGAPSDWGAFLLP